MKSAVASVTYNRLAKRGKTCNHGNSQDTSGFGVNPGTHSHTACIEEVANSDYLLLIIGGRAGSAYIESLSTITNEEFNQAQKLKIPVIAFVRRSVFNAVPIYKKNPKGDFSGIVDNVKVFHFIEYVSSGHESNWLHTFENAEDIIAILKGQFAHYLLNYSKILRTPSMGKREKNELVVVPLPESLPQIDQLSDDQDELVSIRKGTKLLHQIISSIVNGEGSKAGKSEKLKTLWVFGCYAEDSNTETLYVRQPVFKDMAWSYSKGERVFQSMRPLGLSGSVQDIVSEGFDHEIPAFSLCYDGEEGERWDFRHALTSISQTLAKRYGEADGLKLFCKGDFRILGED